MPEVKTRDAQPGMVLSEPATDLLGNPLFEAGRVLQENDIRTLKAWGVASLMVETAPTDAAGAARLRRRRRTTRILRQSEAPPSGGAPPSPTASPSPHRKPVTYAERQQRLEEMFAPHENNPLMQNIRRIAEHQLKRRFATER
ncbi:MAG: hypothetical protein ACOCX4_03605 [Planctomycetota bacterium]